jgi:hypothetical protein
MSISLRSELCLHPIHGCFLPHSSHWLRSPSARFPFLFSLLLPCFITITFATRWCFPQPFLSFIFALTATTLSCIASLLQPHTHLLFCCQQSWIPRSNAGVSLLGLSMKRIALTRRTTCALRLLDTWNTLVQGVLAWLPSPVLFLLLPIPSTPSLKTSHALVVLPDAFVAMLANTSSTIRHPSSPLPLALVFPALPVPPAPLALFSASRVSDTVSAIH